MLEPKKEDAKLAYWLCECGKETIQPTGLNQKLITHCPDCKREHEKCREPDGSITEFFTAPEWFNDEWIAHMKKMGDRDQEFRQLSFQEVEAHEKKVEVHKLLKQTQKHTHNIVREGCRRLKLLKRKDMEWAYNPELKKFLGRKVVAPPPGVKP